MKKIVLNPLLFILFCCSSLFCQQDITLESIQNNPKNIVDYYLLYSDFKTKLYTPALESFDTRKQYLIPNQYRKVTIDKRNGYLKIEETDEYGEISKNITMALFLTAAGERIIGITEYFEADAAEYFQAASDCCYTKRCSAIIGGIYSQVNLYDRKFVFISGYCSHNASGCRV